jgi:membrane-bound lytic murein transglycosylase B
MKHTRWLGFVGMALLWAMPALAQPDGVPSMAERPPFVDWLAALREDALARGISAATLDKVLYGLEPVPRVVERDRSQTEHVLTVDEYIARRVPASVITTARRLAARHASLLAKVEARYEVPRSVIVAIWALESNFGKFSGVRPTIPALATLAWEGRREALFRGQLLDALAIVDSGEVELERLRGSWAGAMGQVQFLPSSYLRYAQDFDGDGRKDIWTSLPDIFASIAHYLREHGWVPGQRWGYRVSAPDAAIDAVAAVTTSRTSGCTAGRELSEPMPLGHWSGVGIRTAGTANEEVQTSLLRAGAHTYLVTRNYEALLGYNCAHAYALSVAHLADAIGASAPTRKPAPKPRAKTGGASKIAHRFPH